MDDQTLQAVVDEILPILLNRTIGKIFQLGQNQLVIDFRLNDGRYLLLNVEPSLIARTYLVRRRLRDLEKQAELIGNFIQFVRKRLANAVLNNISKIEGDRIVNFVFFAETEAGESVVFALVAQLTGRSANIFLLDSGGVILNSLRESELIGQIYAPPQLEKTIDNSPSLLKITREIEVPQSNFELSPPAPLSAKLDSYFAEIDSIRSFEIKAKAISGVIRQELGKKEKLYQRLEFDLTRHGEPAQLKKNGDLLLANAATARREGNQIFVVDYFDEKMPEIVIESDENLTVPEAAEKYFAKYTKARNAAVQLTQRIADLKTEIADLKIKRDRLVPIIAARNEENLSEFAAQNNLLRQPPKIDAKPASKKEPEITSGIRRYRSSDGLEILVGRNSKDNDYLTMRVAKSLDWWLHAADYGGSHVIVRNPSKQELPTKTLIEAAQLAAKFSQAREDSKVAVNYTQRKFVNKPKNAALGLVRLASFRTILIEPKEAGERILAANKHK